MCIRDSHGTAFDIASKNSASPNSMKAAIELAVKLAHAKFDQATQAAYAKEHGLKDQAAKDAALDALSFEDTDAE
jgi:isocitrate/isopropylmalate dehydrogenase